MTARADFPHLRTITTRWDDNDVYGHVNNVRYFAFFDTAINEWLVREGGLDIHAGDVIGLCAESHCAYTAAISFPTRRSATPSRLASATPARPCVPAMLTWATWSAVTPAHLRASSHAPRPAAHAICDNSLT